MAGMPAMVVFPLQKRPLPGSLLMRDQSTRACFLPLDKKGYIETQHDKMRFCAAESKFSQPYAMLFAGHCMPLPISWPPVKIRPLFMDCGLSHESVYPLLRLGTGSRGLDHITMRWHGHTTSAHWPPKRGFRQRS